MIWGKIITSIRKTCVIFLSGCADRMKLPSNYADYICRAHDCDGTMMLMCKCNWSNLGWSVYSGNSFPINKHHILRGWFHTALLSNITMCLPPHAYHACSREHRMNIVIPKQLWYMLSMNTPSHEYRQESAKNKWCIYCRFKMIDLIFPMCDINSDQVM